MINNAITNKRLVAILPLAPLFCHLRAPKMPLTCNAVATFTILKAPTMDFLPTTLLPANTLVYNLVLNTIIFNLAYVWLLKTHMHKIAPVHVVLPILLLESMRHLGLMFLTPGVVGAGIPMQFAWPTAVGDCLAAALAMLAAVLIQRRSRFAMTVLMTFSIVGTLDFIMAIALNRIYQPNIYLGAAYWIPAFWVPMLLVCHRILFGILITLRKTGSNLYSAAA